MAKKRYENVRDQFNRLDTDEKFQFAVEAMIRTIGDIANKAADVASRDETVQTVVTSVKKMAEDIESSFRPKKKKHRKKRNSASKSSGS